MGKSRPNPHVMRGDREESGQEKYFALHEGDEGSEEESSFNGLNEDIDGLTNIFHTPLFSLAFGKNLDRNDNA